MTLLALLLALAQQGSQPTTHDQPGASQPASNDVKRETSTSSNTTDKAESLSPEHHTDLQGGKVAKSKSKKAKSKKLQARAQKPLPEPSEPPSVEQKDKTVERNGGEGKARKQPKPIGEKANQ